LISSKTAFRPSPGSRAAVESRVRGVRTLAVPRFGRASPSRSPYTGYFLPMVKADAGTSAGESGKRRNPTRNTLGVPRVEVVAFDEGPGIRDGVGLPGVGRLMDELHIASKSSKGTAVTIRKWRS